MLTDVLTAHPTAHVTKVSSFTAATGTAAVATGRPHRRQARPGHSPAPAYVHWQVDRSRAQRCGSRPDSMTVVHQVTVRARCSRCRHAVTFLAGTSDRMRAIRAPGPARPPHAANEPRTGP